MDKVRGWWDSYDFHGSPSFVLTNKLKALKMDLKKWNKEEFRCVVERINSLVASIKVLEEVEESRVLNGAERGQKERAVEELEKTLLLEEISWRQKSRSLWLREGDKNTHFFHSIANSHRRHNTIERIAVNGEVFTDPADINLKIVEFYQNLFSETGGQRPLLDNLPFSGIDEADRANLDSQFSEEEVFGAVSSMCGDKAPGPDGFSIAFFQSCWSIIKADLLQVFRHFHTYGTFVKSLNATFLALIPKRPGALDIKEFKPISLVSGVYKIISKVLANWLKNVMDKIVSDSQNAFVGGRQILDLVLIVNECLDSRLRSGQSGVLCKLDMEKAYNHVGWNFLLYMLRRCGFSSTWRRWIFTCISSARFSILVNGSPTGFFESSRGLRQGDPLSPFLFLIVMEALSRLLARVGTGHFIKGFSVGCPEEESLNISHLLFADDTLIFCKADPLQLRYLKGVFIWFQAVSGLKINLGKSELVPVGEEVVVEELAGILGCKVSSLPLHYLGLPLGSGYKDISVWTNIIEKTERRLASWKHMYLSKGGRLTLIKSTLSNLSTYYLSLFPIPKGVAHRLEKIQRDFLWGGLGEEFKFHLVNWKQICTPIRSGGLGIRNLVLFNQALLGKWLWRFATEKRALWRRIIVLKYGSLGGDWCSCSVSGPYGVSLWKSISRGWANFSRFISYKVGDGSSISFWTDNWCGVSPLKLQFPDLYRMARFKNALVRDMLVFQGSNINWDVRFFRAAQDWEVDLITKFMDLLYSVNIS